MRILFFIFLSVLTACATREPVEKKPELVLAQSSFSALPGWGADNLATFIPAFTKSCERVLKGAADKPMGALKAAGTYGDWQPACRSFIEGKPQDLKGFFEARFTPYAVFSNAEPEGLFTGYYEASLKGSRVRSERYSVPLYARADDLVMVQLGDFREDLKGRRIAGRVVEGKLQPYESRAEIVNGDWPHEDNVLVWVDSAVDAFFVQIQGSGVIQMDDGSVMRIGYAGQNGHPYFAIGRELISRGEIEKADISMQSIRQWLEAHPAQADETMNTNKSYVFFRELDTDGPVGGEGVSLTAGRSLAVDRSLMAYGMPIWLETLDAPKLQRLMVAQDTGGAIRGPVRGDVFWGYGERAEALAGPMKARGRYWILLPQ